MGDKKLYKLGIDEEFQRIDPETQELKMHNCRNKLHPEHHQFNLFRIPSWIIGMLSQARGKAKAIRKVAISPDLN